jgi:hypothetical protein
MRDEMEVGDFQEFSNWVARTARGVQAPATGELREATSGAIESRAKTARTGENAVIRQAITCDICATEKKQTNHWFVASEQGGELRVSGWNSRNRLRPGMKHLCGQTCLHKLVDEFMARALAARVPQSVAEDAAAGQPIVATDASLTSGAAYEHLVFEDVQSSARLLSPPAPVFPMRPSPELVPTPGRLAAEEPAPLVEPPRFASRNWRADAWDRERERELRAVERRLDIGPRRLAGS